MSRPFAALALPAALATLLTTGAPDLAALAGRASDEALARASAGAIRGVVRTVEVRRDPAVNAPYTHVTLEVERAWGFGASPRAVELKLLGGTLDGETLAIGGQARFAAGETVFVLVDVRPRDHSLSVTGLDRGKWTLADASGLRVVRRDAGEAPGTAPAATAADLDALGALAGTVVRLPMPGPAQAGEAPGGAPAAPPPAVQAPVRGRWHEADWGVPIAVDSESGGHPLFPGGGLGQLVRAAAAWSGRSPLLVQPGVLRGPRCFANGEPDDGRISVTYGDPCDEIADTSPVLALGGAYYSTTEVRVVGGTAFGKHTRGMVVLDNTASKFAWLSTGCYEQILTHELGHAIGLPHVDTPDAVMSAWLDPACVNRTESLPLQPADLSALAEPYPAAATTPGPPGTPGGLTAVVSGSRVALAWMPSLGPAASAFRLIAGSAPGAADIGQVAVGTPGLVVDGVGRGVYYVRVVAANAHGESAPSHDVVVVVGDGLPGAPIGLLAAAGPGGAVRLAWQPPPGGPGVSRYALLVGVSPDRPTARIAVAQTSIAAQGVPPGTYFVRAVAENGAGAGPASPEIMVVVP
ncbi:MAG: matrixin family metalloprotease [Vicinamibacterales bacterium]